MKLLFVTAHVATSHHTMMRAIGMAPVLAAAGHDVTIVAEDHADNRAIIEPLPNVAHVFVPRTSLRATMQKKASVATALQPDVVHSCGLDRSTWMPPEVRRQTIWIVDHVERLAALSELSWLRRRYYRLLETRALKVAHATVAASRYLEASFREQFFEAGQTRPLLWLPYAVSNESVERLEQLRKARDPACSVATILYAGGFYAAYGIFELLEALCELRRVASGWRFCYQGRGPDRDKLRQQIVAKGLQDWVYVQDYVPLGEYEQALASAAVLVSPMHDCEADWARCPSKLYFYIAAGHPIVTARIGENREALGETGFYYEPGNATDLAAALSAALRCGQSEAWAPVDPRQHTWSARCDQYLAWLNEAVLNTGSCRIPPGLREGIATPRSGSRAEGGC